MSGAAVGFLDVERVVVPRALADAAQDHLRAVGRQGFEGFALWAGRRAGAEFRVEDTIIPAQQGLRSEDGLCVAVGGEELFRINRHLFASGQTLVAQLHSHPTDAYHSTTDDAYPIVTTAGALSLVVPDFAVRRFSLAECAVYRLDPGRGWVELAPTAAARLVCIT